MSQVNLTPRELEILKLVGLGRSAHQIAGELEIEITTVRKHIDNTLKKLGARSQVEAIAKARASDLLGES